MSGGVAAGSTVSASGWVDTSTATYVGAHSLTLSGDLTGTIPLGAKYRYKQGGDYEYGSVVATSYSNPNTTITLATNTDYALANQAITDSAWSAYNCPVGHPIWYNWLPTLTGFSADPTNCVYRFMVEGRLVRLKVTQNNAGTSNATTYTITAPVTSRNVTNARWGARPWFGAENGAFTANFTAYIGANTTTINILICGSQFTASGGKAIDFVMDYEF